MTCTYGKATIDIVNASHYTSKTRHIDVHLRAVRERARAGAVKIQWVPTCCAGSFFFGLGVSSSCRDGHWVNGRDIQGKGVVGYDPPCFAKQ